MIHGNQMDFIVMVAIFLAIYWEAIWLLLEHAFISNTEIQRFTQDQNGVFTKYKNQQSNG